MSNSRVAHMRRATLVLGASVTAMGSAALFPARAQCSPEPVVANTATTCTGTDADGVIVSGDNSTVGVAAGAIVTGAEAPAIGVEILTANNFLARTAAIEVAGLVDGGTATGIEVLSGEGPGGFTDFNGTRATITIADGGAVTGAAGITVGQSAGNTTGPAVAMIDNAGDLSGTGGFALSADADVRGGFEIANRASGTIGAIRGPVLMLDNAGIIDGGTQSAIAFQPPSSLFFNAAFDNTGTIRSDSDDATLAGLGGSRYPEVTFTNRGTITNTGAGAAIDGPFVTLVNEAGGTITGGRDTAISASASVSLVNRGRVNGDVIVTDQAAFLEGSVVDTVDGVIDGDVIFGAGPNTLVARYGGSPTLATGITGTIGGASGNQDRVQLRIDTDITITSGIDAINGFERLVHSLEGGATATLAATLTLTDTVYVNGNGTLVNQGTIDVAGPAIMEDYLGPASYTVVNDGTIRSASAGDFAIRLFGGNLINNGSIVIADARTGIAAGNVINAGAITSNGTAVQTFGTFANDGTVRSTGGTALYFAGYGGANAGLIDGLQTGVRLSGTLTNSGTIRSDGIAVEMENYSQLINTADGIITGGRLAIGSPGGSNRTVQNAGIINGNVDLSGDFPDSYNVDRFYALTGGMVNGDVTLGYGDYLVTDLRNDGPGPVAGVSGSVIGDGGGNLRFQVTGDADAVHAPVAGLTSTGYQLFNDAALTLTGSGTVGQEVQLAGTGSVDLALDMAVTDQRAIVATNVVSPNFVTPVGELSIVSRGAIQVTRTDDRPGRLSAVELTMDRFTNAGTITVRDRSAAAADIGVAPADNLSALSGVTLGQVTNSGTIELDGAVGVSSALTLTNTGRIVQLEGGARSLGVNGAQTVVNSGTISVGGEAVRGFNYVNLDLTNAAGGTIASSSGVAVRAYGGQVVNAGTITGSVDLGYLSSFGSVSDRSFGQGRYIAAGGTVDGDVLFGFNSDVFVQMGETSGVSGIIDGGTYNDNVYLHRVGSSRTIALEADPRVIGFDWLAVEVTEADAVATLAGSDGRPGDLTLVGAGTVVNTGTITGAVNTRLPYQVSTLAYELPESLAMLDNRGTIDGAVTGSFATLRNSGTINGAVALDTGANLVENGGTIAGPVYLGAGDDTFVQRGGTLSATVLGGPGRDLFVMQADAPGAIAAAQITGFEQLRQTGTQAIDWSGAFQADTIELAGGTLAVAAGQVLSTRGAVTVTGGDAGVAVRNAGTIAGAVSLGAGNDRYSEATGASAAAIDGGAGVDTFGVILAGDRTGISARTGFEQLAVEGTGTLTLALDQHYAAVTLADTGLTATLGQYSIGYIVGGAGAERLRLDGEVADIALGGGDDLLELPVSVLTGRYSGEEGTDRLHLTHAGPVTLAGLASGFELVDLVGNDLTVTGVLGAAGDRMTLGDGAQVLAVAAGGQTDGAIEMGAGDDTFRLAAGGIVGGTVAGGAGRDRALLDLVADTSLDPVLLGFEDVVGEGSGTLTLRGVGHAYDRLTLGGDLVIAASASVAATQVAFGGRDDRLTIAGGFAGSVDGGAGSDAIVVTGGTAAQPVAFASLAAFESLQVDGGWSTLAGTAAFERVTLGGGRLVGLAGSTLTAADILVGAGATFGSAGTVRGDVTVAGTLSPGASPGTMTVAGDVTLGTGSTAVFELTPAASDLLAITGALTIAPGATLELVSDLRVVPGQSLDLITATGGITGSFTTIIKPASLFGYVVQEDDRITLLGQFLNDPAYAPPVQGAIDYLNDLLASGAASPALLAAVPLLLDAGGGTSAAGFARLTPQPYAAATQLQVEQGLDLARVARGDALIAPTVEARPFAFATALGRVGELGDEDTGIVDARSDTYGVMGGLGWGSRAFSMVAFLGTLDQRQRLDALGAHTDADGLFGGIHARWSSDSWGMKATIAYSDGDATTARTVPGGTATGHYDLSGWTADIAVDHKLALGREWTLRPSIGVTAIRATREGTVEGGSGAFLLDVARERNDALFVDGSATVARAAGSDAVLRPYLAAGWRYRVDGDAPLAFAALPGGARSMSAAGAIRANLTATGTLGLDVAVSKGLALFGAVTAEAGAHTAQGSAQAGLRLVF